jgi:hypothetical protein
VRVHVRYTGGTREGTREATLVCVLSIQFISLAFSLLLVLNIVF